MNTKVVILKTQVGNVASLASSFRQIGVESIVSNSIFDIENSRALVLPGVGNFAAGMNNLKKLDLVDPIKSRIINNKATLGICLGMQMLFSESEEAEGVKGLGLISEKILKIKSHFPVPQMGWNRIESKNSDYIKEGYGYFANSYIAKEVGEDWKTTSTEYGETFVSSILKGKIMGTQFHPELSGRYGLSILKKWVNNS